MAKNRLDYQAQLSRHSHDTSAGYASSLAPGMIIPQYFDILGPGDSVYYRTHMFARLQDIITAFLGEIDLHIDYFFVPLQMIYTPFGQVFAQTDDFVTSLYANMSSRDTFPTFEVAPVDPRIAYSNGGVPEFECNGKKIMRVLDAFDMNPYNVLHSDFATLAGYTKQSSDVADPYCYNPPVAPWIPCAYHAIFQKYFRNDSLEKLSVPAYNVDAYYNATSPTPRVDLFQLEWAQRPADYYTNTRVSPIASAVNQIGSSTQFPTDGGTLDSILYKVNDFLGYVSSSSYVAFNNSEYQGSGTTRMSPTSVFNAGSTFNASQDIVGGHTFLNAANIRALFAVDKFARIYGRADKTYDDQILAHFGIKVPHDVKHDITHLKHYRAVLQADPIYGTANTQQTGNDLTAAQSEFITTIGQVGGQGQVTLDTDQEKFTAPVHGVFMCVAYVLTKPRYTQTFSKLHLATERLKFPIPEYDKLGAQPLYGFEHSRWYLQPTDPQGHDFRAKRSGWQNRYQEWKEKYNRVSFLYENPNKEDFIDVVKSNIYANWVVSHAPFWTDTDALATSTFMSPFKFFENPHVLDTVMVNPYVSGWSNNWFGAPWTALQSDPILTDYMCFCKKVSWMSETGEPDL